MYQLKKIMRNTNEKSIKTRYRYLQAAEQFCKFVADRYRIQKWINIKSHHITAYVEYLKKEGYSASTVKTDLAGLRFFLERSSNFNFIPSNDDLAPLLDTRKIGHLDRAWTAQEIERAVKLAISKGHSDVAFFIKLASTFGMRIEEACKCQVDHLKKADEFLELSIVGKGGQQRFVHIKTPDQRALVRELLAYAKAHKRFGCDRVLYDNVKGATEKEKKKIQNWISNHREKFEDDFREHLDEYKELEEAARECGVKLRVRNITAHGLRHRFCQQRIRYYLGKGCTPQAARYNVSEEMGHHRESAIFLYMAELRGHKKSDKSV